MQFRAGSPVVIATPDVYDRRFHQIKLDAVSIGVAAANHLVDRGLRNFGYFGPWWGGRRYWKESGFHKTLESLSYRAATCYVCPPENYAKSRKYASPKQVRQWLAKLPKPTGVFAPTDRWAQWLCAICNQEEIRIPEEIAIVGAYNDDLICELSRPTISSVIAPAEQIGYEAAALLDRLMHGEKVPKSQIMVPATEVAMRQSTDILAVSDPDLERATQYLRQHVCEPITIDDMLPYARMPRRSFARKFRSAVGHSPSHELRRLRIEAAKNMLRTNREMKIELVARKCGFANGRSFAAAFRQITHMTPTAYREGETQPKPSRR